MREEKRKGGRMKRVKGGRKRGRWKAVTVDDSILQGASFIPSCHTKSGRMQVLMCRPPASVFRVLSGRTGIPRNTSLPNSTASNPNIRGRRIPP